MGNVHLYKPAIIGKNADIDRLFIPVASLVSAIGTICRRYLSVIQWLDFGKLQPAPTLKQISQLQRVIDQIWQDRQQHIQDKLCYDKNFSTMLDC